MKREPTLKEIRSFLTWMKESFTFKDGMTFDDVYKWFMNINEKCYECSSTVRRFCKNTPEQCGGPHQW